MCLKSLKRFVEEFRGYRGGIGQCDILLAQEFVGVSTRRQLAQEFARVGRVGLWQESGAMQRHKFLEEAAEAPEITRICLSQLTQTLGERIHLTSCKLLSQSAAGTTTPQALALTLASAANYKAPRWIPLQGSKR